MAQLIDIINNNKSLRQVYHYLELGFHTCDADVFQSCLNSFQVDGETLNPDMLLEFRKYITEEMAKRQCSKRYIAEMNNIVTIYGSALISVQFETFLETNIDSAWAINFYDFASKIYDQDIQPLWSKILEIELKKPKSFYKRTLDVFYRADKFELDWFFEITQFVFDKACVPEFILIDNKFYPFNKFQTLIDAGFVNASLGRLSYSESVTMHLTSADVHVEIIKPPLGYSIYTLTDAGSQLFDLRPELNSEEFLTKLKESIEESNIAKVSSIVRKA
jgi:hypothetical protein